MFKKTAFLLALSLCATPSHADPVETRRAAMDQVRVGAATLVPMIKGETEFDPVIAELALRMTYAAALAFEGDLFPEGSTSKGANPNIWATLEDFDAKRADFSADAAMAVKAKPMDLDALKAAYQPLLEDCAACHKAYRIKN